MCRRRVVRAAIVTVIAIAAGACTGNGDGNPGDGDAREETADDGAGSFRIRLEVFDEGQADAAVAALEERVAELDATDAVVDGQRVEVLIRDVSEAEAESIDLTFASTSGVVIRPVLETPPTAGPETLPGPDGEPFVLGPIPSNVPVFGRATVVDSPWPAIELELTEAGTSAFNSLAEQCVDRVPACPLGLIAVVFDGSVLTAPEVRAASFVDSVQISGAFTQEAATEIADQINSSLSPFGVRSIDTDFEPD